MNFLSHYFLHKDDDDNYFTVGLTLPDIITLHNRNVRLTEKFLDSILTSNKNEISLINGMRLHIKIDQWFHRSVFFKEKIIYLQDQYYNSNGKENIAFYYAHILLEILIDRYLLINYPLIADDFYNSYKKFDFTNIISLFTNLRNFNKDMFLNFCKSFSNSDFLKGYCDNNLVINSLRRITLKMGLPIEISSSEKIISDYIGSVYDCLEKSISTLFIDLKKLTL